MARTEQLLDIIKDNQMDDRKIIWVIGRESNEGTSWFQPYIQSLYGSHRAAQYWQESSQVARLWKFVASTDKEVPQWDD